MRVRAVMAQRCSPAMTLVFLVLSVPVSRSGCTLSRVPLVRLRGGMGKRNLDTADEIEEEGMSRATDDVIRARRVFKAKSSSAGEKPRGQGKQFFGMDEKDIPASLGLNPGGGGDQGEAGSAPPSVGSWGQSTGVAPSASPGPGLFPAASGSGLFPGMSSAGAPSSAGTGGLFGTTSPAQPGGGAAGGLQGWMPSPAASGASQGGGGGGLGTWAGQAGQVQPGTAAQGDEERRAAAERIVQACTAPLRALEQKLSFFMAEHLKSVQDIQVGLPREHERSGAEIQSSPVQARGAREIAVPAGACRTKPWAR